MQQVSNTQVEVKVVQQVSNTQVEKKGRYSRQNSIWKNAKLLLRSIWGHVLPHIEHSCALKSAWLSQSAIP